MSDRCRECGGSMDDEWRLQQGDPEDALCKTCWSHSSWGPGGAIVQDGPVGDVSDYLFFP